MHPHVAQMTPDDRRTAAANCLLALRDCGLSLDRLAAMYEIPPRGHGEPDESLRQRVLGHIHQRLDSATPGTAIPIKVDPSPSPAAHLAGYRYCGPAEWPSVEIAADGKPMEPRCSCSVGNECPRGNTGLLPRCTADELRLAALLFRTEARQMADDHVMLLSARQERDRLASKLNITRLALRELARAATNVVERTRGLREPALVLPNLMQQIETAERLLADDKAPTAEPPDMKLNNGYAWNTGAGPRMILVGLAEVTLAPGGTLSADGDTITSLCGPATVLPRFPASVDF